MPLFDAKLPAGWLAPYNFFGELTVVERDDGTLANIYHLGIDLDHNADGTKIPPIANGEWYKSGYQAFNNLHSYGNWAIVEHNLIDERYFINHEGLFVDTYYSFYAHLQSRPEELLENSNLNFNLEVGTIGNSGNNPDYNPQLGIHLHLEIASINERIINKENVFLPNYGYENSLENIPITHLNPLLVLNDYYYAAVHSTSFTEKKIIGSTTRNGFKSSIKLRINAGDYHMFCLRLLTIIGELAEP